MGQKRRDIRKKRYGVRFHSDRSTEQLEKWLDGHCVQNWDIQLAEIAVVKRGEGKKRLVVFFDSLKDRNTFLKFIRNKQYGVPIFTHDSWEQIEDLMDRCSLRYEDIHLGGVIQNKNGWIGKKVTVFFDSLKDKKAFGQIQKTDAYKHFDIRFYTRRPVEDLETWLENSCTKNWNIKLAGVGEDSGGNIVKQLTIRFESHRDRLLFEQHFFHNESVRTRPKRNPLNISRLFELFS